MRIQTLLVLFRVANRARKPNDRKPRLRALPIGVLYKFYSEVICGLELPWKTQVGNRLTIYHGFGMIINDGSVIGNDVVLRHGVTIGNLVENGPCPTIGDHVVFGAGSVVLGGVFVGANSKLGAASLVLDDIPPNSVALAKKATIVSRD